MPEFEASPYPPMTELRGAVAGWLPDDALTAVHTPDAARRTLLAESETSVLDPVGMRRLWLRELQVLLALAVALAVFTGAVVGTVQYVRAGVDASLPSWWLAFLPLVVLLNVTAGTLGNILCRAVPARGVVPRVGPARWRWYRELRRVPLVPPPPPAAWPPGSEAFAVLSGAASVATVAPSWLSSGLGGSAVGRWRLPETHLVVTDAGRERLDRERARLAALAAR